MDSLNPTMVDHRDYRASMLGSWLLRLILIVSIKQIACKCRRARSTPKLFKNGPRCLYNHKLLRTPKASPSSSRPRSPASRGLIGEGGGSRLDSGSPDRTL